MDTSTALYLTMLIPAIAMAGNMVWKDQENLRDGITFLCAVLTFACVLVILSNVGNATTGPYELFEVVSGLSISFHVEPLGHSGQK